MYFSGSLRVQLSSFQSRNTNFAIRPHSAGSQQHVYLPFQSHVKIILGYTVPWHEKRSVESALCWLSYLLLPWWGETVLSDDSQNEVRVKTARLFQKTQIHDQNCCLMKRKDEPVCFSGCLKLQLSRFQRGHSILVSGPNYLFHKNLFSCSFQTV